ncbi:MAG: transposase [Deltaproteobacteria bacterium]|nr:transposase [Deltaproteobacteria bacterium]
MDRNSPDPDARFGRKTPKKGFYGYKSHVVQDADSEFIVEILTTPGNVPDGVILPTLAQPQAQELTGGHAQGRQVGAIGFDVVGFVPGLHPRLLDRDDPGSPGKSAPKSKESSRSANSFTGCAGPATGVWSRSASKRLWWPWWSTSNAGSPS